MKPILGVLPVAVFLFFPLLVAIALGGQDLRSYFPAVFVLGLQWVALLLIGLLRERFLLARYQADPAPPQLIKQARGVVPPQVSVGLLPSLEKEVIWGRSLRGGGTILVSRAILACGDESELARGLRFAAAEVCRPGAQIRSLLAEVAEAFERLGSLRVTRSGAASVLSWAVGLVFLPLGRAFRLWAGPSTYRL